MYLYASEYINATLLFEAKREMKHLTVLFLHLWKRILLNTDIFGIGLTVFCDFLKQCENVVFLAAFHNLNKYVFAAMML